MRILIVSSMKLPLENGAPSLGRLVEASLKDSCDPTSSYFFLS